MASLALLAALGCAPAAPPPNVVLVVVDTLRADRLGAYGNRRGLTPFLDELAARGVVFANAYAASSWTCPSVASLFTSRYPSEHRVATFDSRLAADEVTLAETLAPRHYLAGGFSANFRLDGQLGYRQGFRTWRAFLTVRKLRAHRLTKKALVWVDRAWNTWPWSRWLPRPLFLYLHYMEPHAPYEPPDDYRQRLANGGPGAEEANRKLTDLRWSELSPDEVRLLESLYDAETASLDAHLRDLFRALAKRRVLDHAIVVVTADHGEEFDEHGFMEHGSSLYEAAIRVPLIVLVAGHPGGRVVEQRVSLVDVAPTLLELLGLPREPRFEGRSLVPLLRGEDVPAADVIAELPRTGSAYDLSFHSVTIIRDSVKLLLPREPGTPENETYDLARDPAESSPASPPPSGVLRAARERQVGLAEPPTTRAVDETTRKRLRALGYVF